MAKLTERYPATVLKNDDDERRGRIKVACIGLLGDEESELPMWVEPTLDWGWFYVPDVGEVVEIEVVAGTDLDEHFGQASIDNLDVRWRGKRFYNTAEGTVGEADQDPEVDARLVHAEFKTNYGKRRGFATPWGHVIIFDDTDGDHRISITHSAEQLKHGEAFADEAKFTRIEIEPDGSMKAQLIGKHLIHFQTEGNKLLITLDEEQHKIELDANIPKLEATLAEGNSGILLDDSAQLFDAYVDGGNGAVRLDNTAPSLEVALGGGAGALVDQADGDTVTTLGDGAEAVMIASEMESWLNDTYTPAIADMHDNHFHPLADYLVPLIPVTTGPTIVGTTPGGAPMAPVVPAMLEDYDSAITSQKVFFPAN